MSDDTTSGEFQEAAALYSPAHKMLDPHQAIDQENALARIMFPNKTLTDAHFDKARELLTHFGSLAGTLNASAIDLNKQNVDLATFHMFQAVVATTLHTLQARIESGPSISSWDALSEYLTATMAHNKQEKFKVLYLDRQNNLIADENQGLGTLDHVPVYPREVAKRALELNASSIILAHNHPSGDPTPSTDDIQMTEQVIKACEAIGVTVHDHAVIGHNGNVISFRSEGLMP